MSENPCLKSFASRILVAILDLLTTVREAGSSKNRHVSVSLHHFHRLSAGKRIARDEDEPYPKWGLIV